jgi:hypothetical protein
MLNKKVTDIYFPKKEDFSGLKVQKSRYLAPVKKGLVIFFFFFILLGFFCFFSLTKAEIEIWPETEFLSLEKEAVLPLQVFQKEKAVLESFQSSGKVLKEKKAEGVIRVYNDYSTSSQVLIATTRFVSAEGKVFRTPVAVTIPGGRYEGGKFVSGEIDIRVVADQPGVEYNISSSTFSIPGFAGTDRYTKFYGKSFQSMTGGFKEEVLKITEEDIKKAEDLLTRQAVEECLNLLESELRSEDISAKFNYFPGEFRTEIIEKVSLSLAGEEKKEFKFQVKANCQTLLMEKEVLRDFAKDLLIKEAEENEKISLENSFLSSPAKILTVEESLEINYSLKKIDFNLKEAALFLNIYSRVYSEIDIYNLKNALSGKSLLETELFLKNQPEIRMAAVSFSPFWVKKVPQDLNKIKIKINLAS